MTLRTHATSDATTAIPREHEVDYTHVRAALTCPLCSNEKDVDLLFCWTCYRAHDLRNGLRPFHVVILDHTEQTARDAAQLPELPALDAYDLDAIARMDDEGAAR